MLYKQRWKVKILSLKPLVSSQVYLTITNYENLESIGRDSRIPSVIQNNVNTVLLELI